MYHLRNKQKGLSILLIIMILAGVLFSTIPVFAEENITALTMDSEYFSIIREGGESVTFEIKGLTSNWQKVSLDENQIDKLSVSVDNPDVASVTLNGAFVTVNTNDVGKAVITFTYNGEGVDSVTSNVFVEPDTIQPDAKNVTVSIFFHGKNGQQDIIGKKLDVKPGPITVLNEQGEEVTLPYTLRKSPTVLHAIKQLADKENSPINSLEIDPNFCIITGINGAMNAFQEGFWNAWEYSVLHSGEDIWDLHPKFGPGVYEIEDNAHVIFEYKAITY